MRVGTKSLLFGVHQVFIHPLVVTLAWRKLYGKWPTPMQLVCIIIHDWGSWGCTTMDGADGKNHPQWAAKKVSKYGHCYHDLCLYHSRHVARVPRRPVSALYYADKLSFAYMPWWLYTTLGVLTGEIYEYRKQTENNYITSPKWGHKKWFMVVKEEMIKLSVSPSASPYADGKEW
jgi:hypothetical protein